MNYEVKLLNSLIQSNDYVTAVNEGVENVFIEYRDVWNFIVQHYDEHKKVPSKETVKQLFIPDSPRQDAVAESLVEHYDSELLLSSIDYYVKSKIGPFLLFDFAIESKKITDKVKKEKESKDKFLQIMRETRDRMVDE